MCFVHVYVMSQFPAVNVGLLDCLSGAPLWFLLLLNQHKSRGLSGPWYKEVLTYALREGGLPWAEQPRLMYGSFVQSPHP